MQNAEMTKCPGYGARASAAIAECVFVERTPGANTVRTASAVPGRDIVGVSYRGYDSGDQVELFSGDDVCKMTAGATLSVATDAHYLLTADSSGRAIPWTAALGLPVLAAWIPRGQASVAANESIIVRLIPQSQKAAFVSGTVTISAASSSAVAALSADLDGYPVQVSAQRHDATLGGVDAEWDGSGNLTVAGETNATADTIVSYIIYVV